MSHHQSVSRVSPQMGEEDRILMPTPKRPQAERGPCPRFMKSGLSNYGDGKYSMQRNSNALVCLIPLKGQPNLPPSSFKSIITLAIESSVLGTILILIRKIAMNHRHVCF